MERKLMDYLPYVLRDYREFQGITDGQQPEFELAWNRANSALAEQFVLTATGTGLSRLEKILGITQRGTDTVEERRFRILSRLNEELPYTLTQLRNILQVLCGAGNFSVNVDTDTDTLYVKIGLSAAKNFHDVEELLQRVTPQNLFIDLQQLYNSHQEAGRFTHAQLAAYTHDQIRNEVFSDGGENNKL